MAWSNPSAFRIDTPISWFRYLYCDYKFIYIHKITGFSCHKIIHVVNLPFSLELQGRFELTSWMIFSISILPKSVRFINFWLFNAFQEASSAKNWQHRKWLDIKKLAKHWINYISKGIHKKLWPLCIPDSRLVDGVFSSHLQAC